MCVIDPPTFQNGLTAMIFIILPVGLLYILRLPLNNNNNNNFLCANILENQAQWRDKTKGLSNCVNVEQCVSR